MSNEREVIDSTIDTETTENNEDTTTVDVDGADTTEADDEMITISKKDYETIKAQKDHWKNKATKPKEEKPKEVTKAPINQELSQKDLYALMKADVAEDDVEYVQKFARLEGITVAEAIKNDDLKGMLSLRAEKRAVAQATNTKGTPRGTAKISGEALLERASKGQLPDSDDEMEKMVAARKAAQKNRK